MSAKTFVDTHVLIYAHDTDAGAKHATAKAVLRELWGRRAGVLSTQVLQEFYVNVTRKIAAPLPKPTARAVVDSYTVWCIDTTPAEISAAFLIQDEAGIGFWDALIVAAARKAGAVRRFESGPDHRRSAHRKPVLHNRRRRISGTKTQPRQLRRTRFERGILIGPTTHN